MNKTNEQNKGYLNPCGFERTLVMEGIRVIDINKWTVDSSIGIPITQPAAPPSFSK